MVKKINFKGKTSYQCEQCQMIYQNKKIAEKCEVWCRKNHSCNLLIIKHAINVNNK